MTASNHKIAESHGVGGVQGRLARSGRVESVGSVRGACACVGSIVHILGHVVPSGMRVARSHGPGEGSMEGDE
jgi:hypothetical protein